MRMARPLAGPIWHMCSPRRPSPPRGAQMHPEVLGPATGRASFPVSQSQGFLGGAATAGRQAPSWTPACARPHQGAAGASEDLKALRRKFAAQAGGVRPCRNGQEAGRSGWRTGQAGLPVRRTCCIRRVPPPSPGPRCSGVAHWMRCGCRPNAFRRAGWVPRR